MHIFLNRITFNNRIIYAFFIIYFQDGTYTQKLIPPLTEAGQKRTLEDLLEDFSTPVRKAGNFYRFIFFICSKKKIFCLKWGIRIYS